MLGQFFITATGTDIGKSFYLQKLCQEYRAKKQKFHAIKPIISGFDFEDNNNDTALILKSLELENNLKNLDKISPWRFKNPLAPNIAASLENKEIKFEEVVNFCQKQIKLAQGSAINLLIEGAGGVMTPITNNHTFLDLMKILQIPVILVTGDYLGTISHTLCAIRALESENIKIAKIIFNQKDPNNHNQKNWENLNNFTNKTELLWFK